MQVSKHIQDPIMIIGYNVVSIAYQNATKPNQIDLSKYSVNGFSLKKMLQKNIEKNMNFVGMEDNQRKTNKN